MYTLCCTFNCDCLLWDCFLRPFLGKKYPRSQALVRGRRKESLVHMCQVPLITCILLRCTKLMVSFVYLLKDRTAQLYSLWDTYGRYWSKKHHHFAGNGLQFSIRGDGWISKGKIASFTCCHHLAEMDECVDNSCKQRAEYLHRSLVIVCRERGQWQGSFIREKSACFAEVSVMEQILWDFPNSQKSWENWACTNCVYQALFSPPTHEPGNEARAKNVTRCLSASASITAYRRKQQNSFLKGGLTTKAMDLSRILCSRRIKDSTLVCFSAEWATNYFLQITTFQ